MDASDRAVRLPKTRRVPEAFATRRLTDRSLRIIEVIGHYRFIPTSNLLRLIGGNEDVTHRHLQALFHKGVISRLKLPSEPVNSEFVYFLENSAALRALMNDRRMVTDFDFAEIRLNRSKYGGDENGGRQRTGRLLFIEHELMISRLHAALEFEAKQSQDRTVLENWQQGNATWDRVQMNGTAGFLPHRPDAYFSLRFPNAIGGQTSRFFYEADRDTTNRTKFRLKLEAYLQFFLTGQYSKKYGARKVRAVLVEAPSIARTDQLKRIAAELATKEPLSGPLFWFTASGLIREKGIFDALWSCAADQRPRSLLD